MSRPNPDLAATRYGRRQRRVPRRVWVIATAILVCAGAAWSWWASQSFSDEPVTAQVRSFDVQSEHRTGITLQVRRNADGPATCEVYAEAMDQAVVGERTVKVPSSAEDVQVVSSVITTNRRAANADVRSCQMTG